MPTALQVIQILRATAQSHTLNNQGGASAAAVQMSADATCLRGAAGGCLLQIRMAAARLLQHL
jgi:hypothetical protein